MKYLIFLDIDGTLLTRHGVAARTLEAIRRATNEGHLVFINTGRSKGNIPFSALADVPLTGIVAGLGAYIEMQGEVLFSHAMSIEEITRTMQIADEINTGLVLEGEQMLIDYRPALLDPRWRADRPAIDYVNETLKTDFKIPREYFENNFVDELISYYEYYFGVVTEHPGLIDAFPDNAIYFLLSPNPELKSGYYIKRNNKFELVESLTQIPTDCISFVNKDINSYLDKYNFSLIPDKYIRQIIVYYAAALYLEEEDELENQYAIYKSRAEQSLAEWQNLDFSVFDISESNRRFL